MSTVKILSAADVERLFTIPMAIETVERAYLEKHSGQGAAWPMVFHEFDPGHADLDIKSGHLGGMGVYGLKVLSWFEGNPGKGLPDLFGTSLLFDLATGTPKAVLNAGPVTRYRTGAAAAIGAKYLARPDSKTLLIAGCGGLSPYLTAAAITALPGLERVLLTDPRFPENGEKLCPAITKKVDELMKAGGASWKAEILPAELEAGVGQADIIFTATPAYEPYLKAEWVRPGAHLSCIGADLSGKEEVEPELFHKARVFGDDEAQCLSVGECEIPHKKGILSGLLGEIGGVMAGALAGRTTPEDITIFDSTGIALQDLASAADILETAIREGAGVDVEL
ncbi:MAG: ornithine cyclodeaminase family protein [Dysosmobacter sp.]|nr:ornithine cyclodeaminase family protein [Dysosmobacter sp.]